MPNSQYIQRIASLISDLEGERELASAADKRSLSIAITHLEDALYRVKDVADG